MASWLNRKTLLTLGLGLAITGIFLLLLTKHYEISGRTIQSVTRNATAAAVITSAKLGLYEPCAETEELVIFSLTVYHCSESQSELIYGDIYTLYPASAGGEEVIYMFIDRGEKSRADEMLNDVYDFDRYEAVTLPAPLTWTEDPFNERYWRFLFYSLRPVRHLIATAEETGAERYYEKTREITESFLDEGADSVHAWDDPHGAAFRTMMLVNIWWKLRTAGELPSGLSDKILASLETHGDFLLDPENYEGDQNHAVTQAAALLLLAQNFPDLANAEIWRTTATRRLDISLSSIIDSDGVLIENSPYYHFYVLEKYWEINKYTNDFNITISDEFEGTIDRMIRFATYVLRPDQSVPLLGASTPRTISRSGEFREIAADYPEFNYVVTSGKEGERPTAQHLLSPSSGIALLRSGWGEDRPYELESQLLFDTGPYRTDHSDFDVLTVSLFGNGTSIIRDTGLFTYETGHRFYNYFHGTRGHNTVMVDGLDQPPGEGEEREIETAGDVAWTAAWHELYDGVRHSRSVALIGSEALLVVDDLMSDTEHTYEQLWHFPPETRVTDVSSAIVEAVIDNENGSTAVRLHQLLPGAALSIHEGEEDPPRGLCASGYEVLSTCPELSFTASSSRAQFITLITYGDPEDMTASYATDTNTLSLQTPSHSYQIAIEFPGDTLISAPFIELAADSTSLTNPSLLEQLQNFVKNIF